MKKNYANSLLNFFCGSLVLILLFTIVSRLDAKAQDKRRVEKTFFRISDTRQKVIDLTRRVGKECTQSLVANVGSTQIEIKFSPSLSSTAEQTLSVTKRSIEITQSILKPLPIKNLKVYLLEMTDVPANYQIKVPQDKEIFFPYLHVFSKGSIELNCEQGSDFCTDIVSTLPHELTHDTLDDLIDRKSAIRWLDDGLADYVAIGISSQLYPSIAIARKEQYAPEVSLNREDIRENLWKWKDPLSVTSLMDTSEKEARNETFYYGAAYQLINLIVEEAIKQKVEHPLETLLQELIAFRERNKKAATSEDILAIINQHLKVNPKTLGILNEETQKQYVKTAIDILSQSESETLQYQQRKYYALVILAGIGKIQLEKRWLNYLLTEIYKNTRNNFDFSPNLAATALAIRMKQKEMDEVITQFISSNHKIKDKSLKAVKEHLQELSIR
jgi:hypothetical protein